MRKYRIKELAEKNGMSYMDVAKAINVNMLTVGRWASLEATSSKNISAKNIKKLAEVFKVSPVDIKSNLPREVEEAQYQ